MRNCDYVSLFESQKLIGLDRSYSDVMLMIHPASREVHGKGYAVQKALVVLPVDAALTTQSHGGTGTAKRSMLRIQNNTVLNRAFGVQLCDSAECRVR